MVLSRVVLAAQNIITAEKQETCTSARLGGSWREIIQEEAETVGKTWIGLGNSWQCCVQALCSEWSSRQQLAVLYTGPAL
jgi:hypothetical protein